MSKKYKRIGKTLYEYAMYPETTNIDDVIDQYGEEKDYYESIFKYKQNRYDKYISGLKDSCNYLNYKFNEKDILGTTTKVMRKLKKLSKEQNDSRATELLENVSVSGEKDVYTHKLVFDFDHKQLETARIDTIELVDRLMNSGLKSENIQLSFSGNKGFSIEVETEEKFTQPEFWNIVDQFGSDLQTLDDKVKDPQRLFRVPLTKHNSSGLYKTPLTINELKNLSETEIRTLAKELQDDRFDIVEKWSKIKKLPISITSLKSSVKEKEKTEVDVDFKESSTEFEIDLSVKPSWLSSARYILQQGYIPDGQRNHAMMILASTYKNIGFDKTDTYHVLKAVNEKREKVMGIPKVDNDVIWREVISTVYSDLWTGGQYSDKTDPLLLSIKEKYNLVDDQIDNKTKNISEMHERFIDFAKNIDKNTIKTGIKQIDDNVLITTGMLVGLLGAPSSGKSSFALNFLKHTSKNNEKSFFFSLDMPDNLIYARLVSMFHKERLGLKTILDKIKTGETDDFKETFNKMHTEFNNVNFDTKSGTSVEDIRARLTQHQKITGEKIRLVVVDYLERVHGPYSDPTQNSGLIASQLADIARDFDTAVLLLLQPQKMAGDPSDALLSMRKVKGSSRIEQDCRIIFTMWRPGFNPQDSSMDRFASVAVVKNNMGGVGQFDFKWDGAKGSFEKLSLSDQQLLSDVIKEKEEKKKADKANGGIF